MAVKKKIEKKPAVKKASTNQTKKERLVKEAKDQTKRKNATDKIVAKQKGNSDKSANTTTTKKPKKVNYLNNKDLLADVIDSKKVGIMSDKLARKLQLLTEKYAKKGNYAGYTYNDDMQAYAMMMLVKTWDSFDPEKSQNPFAFFTQCIKHSFIQYLNQEKKQRNIRDELLVDIGLTPSYTYQLEQDQSLRDKELKFDDHIKPSQTQDSRWDSDNA